MWALHVDYFIWSHGLKSHTASPFDHLDLANGMVPMMTLLALCDTDTNIMTLHNQKCYTTHCFKYLDLMNTMMLSTMVLTLHDVDASTNSIK